MPRGDVPRLFADADALINNSRSGSSDKVVYEAAAACLPVFASSPTFDDLLPDELRFPHDDPAALARRLVGLASSDRREVAGRVREQVRALHSVETWAEEILDRAS